MKTATDNVPIESMFTVENGRVVWKDRDADFYRRYFPRAYSPEGAAANWAIRCAGKEPTWRYDRTSDDFKCTASFRPMPLKAITAALGVPYSTAREAAEESFRKKKTGKARDAVLSAIELKNGVPHWKVRTTAAFPSTAAAKLHDFNSRFAGQPLKPRSDGLYRVRFCAVSLNQMKEWLK
jgi:hypothetical protein